jgi:puromycin-sensitive aminopeptidase
MHEVRRLYELIQPERYVLKTKVDVAAQRFNTQETIDFELTSATQELVWHASGLEISKVRLNGESIEVAAGSEPQSVIFRAKNTVPAGSHHIEVEFSGIIQESLHGLYQSNYVLGGEAKKMAVTQFEAIHAREAFVAIDEPSAKAVFELTVSADAALTIVANTEVLERTKSDGWQTVRFAPTPRMSTYLVAYVIGELIAESTTTSSGVEVRVLATPDKASQLEFAVDIGRRALEFYETYFDIPYPLKKIDMIAIPDFAAGAMENWGCITYRETDLLVDPAHSTLANRQRVGMVIAHELAHQWFGNLVTMEWWNDLWLNESFASWAETVTLDALFPEWHLWDDFTTSLGARARQLDGLENTHPVEVAVPDPAGIDEIFDAISYWKGQSILRMLASFIGEDPMRDGLRQYLSDHAYANARTTDLWSALEAKGDQPVRQIMEGWTREPGFPVIDVKTVPGGFDLSQRRFAVSGATDRVEHLWSIPVTAMSQQGPLKALFNKKAMHIEIAATWLKLNLGQTGFYRVAYDAEASARILPVLAQLEPIDRYGVIDDQFALAPSGSVATVAALELTTAAREAQDYPTWTAVLDGLGSVARLYAAEEPERAFIDNYIVWLTRPLVDRLGWEPEGDETSEHTLLRQAILAAAGQAGNKEVIVEGLARFAARDKRTLGAELESVVYGLVARFGESPGYAELRRVYDNAHQPQAIARLQTALAMAGDRASKEATLELALSPAVRAQDSLFMIGRVMASRGGAELAWAFVESKWDELVRRYGEGGHMIERLPEFAAMAWHTDEKAELLEQFFLREHPMAATGRATRQAAEQIRMKATWRKREGASLSTWLLHER